MERYETTYSVWKPCSLEFLVNPPVPHRLYGLADFKLEEVLGLIPSRKAWRTEQKLVSSEHIFCTTEGLVRPDSYCHDS